MKKFYDAGDPSQTNGGTIGADPFREESKETPEAVTGTPVVETPSVPEEPKPVFDAEKINERVEELKKEEPVSAGFVAQSPENAEVKEAPVPTAKVYEPLPAGLQSAVVKEDFERVGPDGKPIRNPNAEPLPKGARAMTKDYVAHIKKEKDGN